MTFPDQVMKTLEQSIMEVEEEHELAAMSQFKQAWYERLVSSPCYGFATGSWGSLELGPFEAKKELCS